MYFYDRFKQTMNRYMNFRLLLGCVLSVMIVGKVKAQQAVADTSKQEVQVDHVDVMEFVNTPNGLQKKLNGHVELSQDSLFMYCDRAIIEGNQDVTANGHVIIQQNDSVSVFSDSLYYQGGLRVADLFGEVILVNGTQHLFTNVLNYNFNTRLATYNNGATLVNNSAQLTSKTGYYDVGENMAYFKDSVMVVDSTFLLKADTLKFNTLTEVVEFVGPTLIKNDSIRVYCESGFYDTRLNIAEFRTNAQFEKGGQQATGTVIRYDGADYTYELIGNAKFKEADKNASADTIRYDERSNETFLLGRAKYKDVDQEVNADQIVYNAGSESYQTQGRSIINNPPHILEADAIDYNEVLQVGIAIGNVIWRDTSSETTIFCDKANYDQADDYLKAFGGIADYGRPYMTSIIDADTLFLAADTLLSFRMDSIATDSSSRALVGYPDVRVYKSNLQAICDSMAYLSTDSMFYFYDDPIMWSDTSQFSADTMRMAMKNDQIDKVFLSDRALIINSPDELFYNQIKGRFITAQFLDQNLHQMHVEGNAESVYYVLDEANAYVGVNKTVCSEMVLHFGDNQVDKILFLDESQAKLQPMRQANHDKLKLDGFFWERLKRPKKFEDLFDRPLRKGVSPLNADDSLPEVLSGSPPPEMPKLEGLKK